MQQVLSGFLKAFILGCFSYVALAQGPGNAINFTGANNIVEIADNGSLDVNDSVTIEAWVYPTGTDSYNGIVSKSLFTDAFHGSAYVLRLYDNTARIQFWISRDGEETGSYITTSAGALIINQWNHIAVQFASSQFTRMYINGALDIERTDAVIDTIFNSSESFRIGKNNNAAENSFPGMIDEVRIWNAVLDVSTLQSWRKKTLIASHPNFSNLVGYWKFDEGSGTTTADGSGGGNTGTLVNSPAWVISTAPLDLGSIGGMKWNDANGNGVKELGENTLSNWKIRLAGAKTDSQLTDVNGNYSFTELFEGSYTVSEELQSTWTQTAPPVTRNV
ncbi:MAG: hypothetical protein EPO24_16400 [Bacteroidetes bacterium]|nr:MAG: hypothetical protein EPO24_16400 [Bacteroidota bacterium]